MILWTRRPFAGGTRQLLTVEVADDETLRRVIAQAKTPVSSAADWTARVLIGGLKPALTYWYRFTDADGNGSRVGRTITAPLPNDPRTNTANRRHHGRDHHRRWRRNADR